MYIKLANQYKKCLTTKKDNFKWKIWYVAYLNKNESIILPYKMILDIQLALYTYLLAW